MGNHKSLADLIQAAKITRKEAALYIADETKRPCSLRSVQSWLANTETPSARPCPEWAVSALESRLRLLEKI
jgi:hypothetical protein